MHWLGDGDFSLLLLAVEHRSTPFSVHRFNIPLHGYSVSQNLHFQKVHRLLSLLIVLHAPQVLPTSQYVDMYVNKYSIL
jgi:hypothetical protein